MYTCRITYCYYMYMYRHTKQCQAHCSDPQTQELETRGLSTRHDLLSWAVGGSDIERDTVHWVRVELDPLGDLLRVGGVKKRG